jgi:hypothetical protein
MRYTYHPIKKEEEARKFAQEMAKRVAPYLIDQLVKRTRNFEHGREIYVD